MVEKRRNLKNVYEFKNHQVDQNNQSMIHIQNTPMEEAKNQKKNPPKDNERQ
jgi:hypothetical protein